MTLIIDRKRSIGDAAKEIGVAESVLRYWGSEFEKYVKPTIGNGGRRYYYNKDIKILKLIKQYLHDKGFTIKGLQKLFETEGFDINENLENKANNKPINETNNKIENKIINNPVLEKSGIYGENPKKTSVENNEISKNITDFNDYKNNILLKKPAIVYIRMTEVILILRII